MLSPEQKAVRAGRLTASRIAALMNGNAEEIMRLYLEMIGEAVEEDLSRVWPVRLGEATEQLQLDWFQEKYGLPVTRRGEVVVHPVVQWAACTLDAWVEDGGADYPIECKHVGGREPVEIVIDRYQPQMQWQMFVTRAKELALSIIIGASEPVVEYVDRNDPYIAEMLTRGTQFMEFVARREPPVVLDPVPPPIDMSKIYDMGGSNEWGSAAAEWIATEPFARKALDAAKTLKNLVPKDAKKVFGHGVRITRDRAGRLSLRMDDLK
jgi:hypothetical protein